MTDPAVWRHVSDDGTPAPELWRPVESDSVWYVSVHEGEQLLGMFVLAAHNFICWEIHTCLLPVAWGPLARRVALAMAAWIWENTPCRRLITNVPTCNRIALRFAKDAGMLQYGFNEKSILKGGRKCDQICLGLTKED